MPDLKQNEQDIDSNLNIKKEAPLEEFSDLLLKLEEQRNIINKIF